MLRNQKRYQNLDNINALKSYKDVQKWQRERRRKKRAESYIVPQATHKEIEFLQKNRTQATVTWIGHATFLIQCAGLNLITDPVFAQYLGLFKRLSAPGLSIEDLPSIDAVLISHAHYDHLNFRSIRALPGQPKLLVPEGLAVMMKRKGFKDVAELSWWQTHEIGNATFIFVPAQHWTRRTLWDTNTSHWGGWIIRDRELGSTIYFAGDSGYFRGFKAIQEACSPIDAALLPIGAYDPEWFMKEAHMTPEEAVQAYLDLEAGHFIPMHYGTFRLADDTAEEAVSRLSREWTRLNLPMNRLHVLKLGETFRINHAV